MKRLIIALLVGGMVFGAAFAAAAALNVSAPAIQAGGVTDLVCDDDGVDVSTIGFEWSDADDAYVVTGVIVTGIHTDCDFISVTLTDNSGFEIETMALGGVSGSATLTPSGTVKVEDLGDIHVLLTGTP